MARKTFRKLVRDLIPDIIRQNGDVPVTKKLSVKEYKKELIKKLREEVEEVLVAKKREDLVSELADVQEVLTALYEAHHIECSEVTETARKKRKARGAFTKKIFLIETR